MKQNSHSIYKQTHKNIYTKMQQACGKNKLTLGETKL